MADTKYFVSQENLKEYHDKVKATFATKVELSGKADSATTLAGYKISDAYTKGQTDSKIAEEINKIDKLTREIVTQETLEGYISEPSTAKENVIYMVKVDTVNGADKYKEYMKVGEAIEQIGDTSVDLTDYVKNSALDGYVTKTELQELDVTDTEEEGKYVSSVTQEDGRITVTKKALPTHEGQYEKAGAVEEGLATIVTGTTNGTFNVGERSVAIHGLQSAAYVEASTFATSTQGEKADTALQPNDIQALTTGFADSWFTEE